MNTKQYSIIVVTLAAMYTPHVHAVELANLPLFLTAPPAPNLIVTLDTSGSMEAAHTPDALSTQDTTKRYKSAYYNPMYYNPAVIYAPPIKSDGTKASTTFTEAYINGFDTGKGFGNLNTQYKPTKNYGLTSSGNTYDSGQTFAGGTNPFATPGTPVNHSYSGCIVNFDNIGANDKIIITSGCLGRFATIPTGTVITVAGSTRAGTYTVIATDTSSSVGVGNRWTSDLNNQTVTLSWSEPGTTINPAYYYRFDVGASGCDGTKTDEDCYVAVKVSSTSGSGTIDLNGDGSLTSADRDELQNFANWYSFYRVRTLAMVTAADLAFWSAPTNIRVAWQNLNTCNTFVGNACQGRSGTNYPNYIKEFSGTHRSNFFKWLFDIKTASGTPLRIATQRVGKYVSNGETTINDPYAESPQVSAGNIYSCRKNFHILMTDGEWNTTGETGLDTYGSLESDLPLPYKDDQTNRLSDVIYYYWKNDLRPSLTDNVQKSTKVDASETITDGTSTVSLSPYNNPKNNPATWQHITTFTMGLGLTATLTDPVWAGSTYAGGYNRLVTGSDTWTDVASDTTRKIYDLWHGALDSRGQFFSTEDPAQMTNAFQSILNAIDADTSSSSGLSTNSTSIRTDSVLFQARFNPREWSGQLLAYPVASSGPDIGDLGIPVWDASTKMNLRDVQKISTWVPGVGGRQFDWDNLSNAQKVYLNKDILGTVDTLGPDRVDWIKGIQTKEQRFSGAFRDRKTTVLGDIANADLIYTRDEDFGYGSASFTAVASEGATYNTFLAAKQSTRPGMVYAGANDGMLHAFTADKVTGGVEKFAYIPNAVYSKLSALTSPNYVHQYYVDGAPFVADAYIGSWKTVLVSGLANGGKAVFALDVSNPLSFNPVTDVLWEKTNTDLGFTNLGHVYGQPKVVRIASGWVAIFGNGYNSSTGKASLFVVKLSDGSVLSEIVVDGAGPDNGLSEPAIVDTDGDRIADYAYAGDLKGNLWKFDLTTFTSPYKLFTAGSTQPITSLPTWGPSPDSSVGGIMVYFGTGQYLGAPDVSTVSTQSFYGIWDRGGPVDKSDLQPQTILNAETNADGRYLRKTSSNEVIWSGVGARKGWYMDMGFVDTDDNATGERIVKKAKLSLGWLLFTTVVPKNDRCDAGGESWFFLLDPKTGKAPSIVAVDLNKDDIFDNKDALSDTTAPSAAKSTIGILSAPFLVGHDSSASFDVLVDLLGGSGEDPSSADASKKGTSYANGSNGSVSSETIRGNGAPPPPPTTPPPGVNRIYWRQIQ